MSKFRRAARVDENQSAIVEVLRDIPGVKVELGHDDILVGYKGVTYWFELKDPAKLFNAKGEIKTGQIKPSQFKLVEEWTGHYQIVWELDQILREIGVI